MEEIKIERNRLAALFTGSAVVTGTDTADRITVERGANQLSDEKLRQIYQVREGLYQALKGND